MDRNISESDPLVKVANITSTLIFRTLQYKYVYVLNILGYGRPDTSICCGNWHYVRG